MRRRSKQVAEAHPLDGVRSMWEFLFISQFLRFFQEKLGFVHLDIGELENAFLEAENYPVFSIFARLLRVLLGRCDVRISNWEETLKVELEERGAEPNPLEDGNYSELAPGDRVFLLKCIIDYICDSDEEKFSEMKEFKDDFTNPEERKPIGQDTQGYTYWYFDDLRLYREKSTRKGAKKSWATVCTTTEDWENVIKSLQKNKENEKKLREYLQDELYPSVEPLLKENEKEEDLKSRKKKTKSNKSKKEASKEEERDELIKQEEEEIEKMKQEEQAEKQRNMENEHRKKGRRKREIEQETSSPESSDDIERDYKGENEDLENRISDELDQQESLLSAEDLQGDMMPRTRRKCVIMREQAKKKKEWWEEEGIGSDLEDDEDIDSDSSDGPRRRKKKPKLMRPADPPGPMNRTYVFSTILANRAAEAVQQGRVESIVSFHRAQQTTSPYLRLEKGRTFDKNYDQQKAYFSQGYQQPGMGAMMSRGYGRIPGMLPDGNTGSGGRGGYNPGQWQQFQMQPPYMKERQQRQPVDDLSQILFGGAVNGNGQNQAAPGSFTQRPGMSGQQYGYPQRMGSQQQPYQDSRVQEGYRQPFQQGYNQQQQYFQRPRNLPQLHSPGGQSPSSDPLGANVRSPPPPYPGARSGESRPPHHMGNSPAAVPSPTSTGSPQTPLTPHTPRFPGAAPSPGEPSKPPFSPTNPQQSNYSAGTFPGAQRPGSESSGSDTGGEGRGFVDLGSKGYQNATSSQPQSYPGMGENNQDSSLQSPTEPRTMGTNKSPFLAATQGMSSIPASMPKSFSVESLTAPSVPSDHAGHPLAPEQQMGPYSGIYYQTKYQPPAMYGGQRYQYPSTIQHTGSLYNPQLSSNMYFDRGSMPVYPPGREPGL